MREKMMREEGEGGGEEEKAAITRRTVRATAVSLLAV
jgi:hypothetical protein